MHTKSDAGILTAEEIKRKNLVPNFLPGRLQSASYDLGLGREYRDSMGQIRYLTNIEPQLTIPAYGVAFVSTEELVQTDSETVGRFDLMVRHALAGIFLQVGTQVEPNYFGRLFGLLFNLSADDVALFKGQPIFTIEFNRLVHPVTSAKSLRVETLTEFLQKMGRDQPVFSYLTRIEEESRIVQDLSRDARQKFIDLQQQLEHRVAELETRFDQKILNRWAMIGAILAVTLSIIFGAVLPLVLSKITYDRDDALIRSILQHYVTDSLDPGKKIPPKEEGKGKE